MSEILDIVGKELVKEREVIFLTESGELNKGIIKAFNKDGFVKVEDAISKKTTVVKVPNNEIYMYPEEFNLNEIFEVDYVPKEKKPTKRDFNRQLAVAKDIFGDGLLDGDKVLFIDSNKTLKLGRTLEVEQDTNKVHILGNRDNETSLVLTNGKNLCLLKRDYYIKEKAAYE